MQNIADNQVNAEVPINENFLNVLWAELGARNPVTTTGLTWGYIGGQMLVNGVPTTIAAGTVTLTASSTNYVGITQAGVVANAVGTPNPLHAPLYTVVTGTSTITSYVDTRSAAAWKRHSHGTTSQALTTANVTLSQAQALCDTLVVTGTLTAVRDLVVPLLRRRWVIRHTGSAFGVRIIGASGTGITVAPGTVATVECDGTNVFRVTADV
jgi:hypothetical protein